MAKALDQMYHPKVQPCGPVIPGLRAFWNRQTASRSGGKRQESCHVDPRADQIVLAGLKLGLRETLQFLMEQASSYDEFETWVRRKNGGNLNSSTLERLEYALNRLGSFQLESILPVPVLTTADLKFWDDQGYVVVRRAVSPDACTAALQAILTHAEMSLGKPDSWYQGDIWIPLAHHPALWANRNSPRIHTAFAQVWGRSDLWVTVDVCGVNPPLRAGYGFRGTPLHWDMTLAPPLQFGTQAILYLTDTPADQGAFSCVPGFHRELEGWLKQLPEGADARALARAELQAIPIPGEAGDLIIWHHALPHAATPNVGSSPRVVQYLNMFSGLQDVNAEWL